MAVPESMTTMNFAGKYTLASHPIITCTRAMLNPGGYLQNKHLSDDTDEVLRLQGVNWLVRKTISVASVYITIRHYHDDAGLEHIDIHQALVGGVGATVEERALDWNERERNKPPFGSVLGKSRRVKLDEIDDEFLRDGWIPSVAQDGLMLEHAHSNTEKSGRVWFSNQTIGLEDIGGTTRLSRHVHFTGPNGEHVRVKIVYDYEAPLAQES